MIGGMQFNVSARTCSAHDGSIVIFKSAFVLFVILFGFTFATATGLSFGKLALSHDERVPLPRVSCYHDSKRVSIFVRNSHNFLSLALEGKILSMNNSSGTAFVLVFRDRGAIYPTDFDEKSSYMLDWIQDVRIDIQANDVVLAILPKIRMPVGKQLPSAKSLMKAAECSSRECLGVLLKRFTNSTGVYAVGMIVQESFNKVGNEKEAVHEIED
jgi:hypothetical protein